MENEIITLDIEMENTGYNIMEDNKRIISVQLLEGDVFTEKLKSIS